MRDCDVAIVGGGLIGCASAYYLSRAGARTVLLEREEVNSGASGRNAGSLHFQLEHRQIVHKDSLRESLARIVRLHTLAIADWQQLEAELGIPLELVMHGGLMLAETAEEVSLLELKCRLERQHGLETHLLSGAEARSHSPHLSDGIKAAALCPQEGHCNPRTLTSAYADRALALGAAVLTRTRVVGIHRANGSWRLDLERNGGNGVEREVLKSDKILNAAGAWSAQIAAMIGIHLPIFPIGLTMNVTEEVAPVLTHLIQHVGRRISLKQVEAGNILIGGGWPAILRRETGLPPGNSSAAPSMASIQKNLQTAIQIVPAIGGTCLLRSWAGITGVTSDQLPLLGEVAGAGGFYVAAGGAGFTMGPTYARLTSALIMTGKAPESLADCSPARFDHINMFRA